jgi:uncharacterized membrane protein
MNPKQLARYFLRGCLVLTPLALTIYIVFLILRTVDQVLPIGIPGVGILVTVLLIMLAGFLTTNVVGKSVLDVADRAFTRLPLVKLIYTSIKDLIGAFVGDRRSFRHAVTVALVPDGTIRALGFVTRDSLDVLGLADHVAVYFPQSYNFAGNLLLVARDRVQVVDTSSSEVMTFIVSGGISGFGVGKSVLPPPMLTAPTEPPRDVS